MTQRHEVQQRVMEQKAVLMTWVGNKLFTFKQTGIDGLLKRMMLKPKRRPGHGAEE